MTFPHSNAVFVKVIRAKLRKAFCDGHVSAYAFFGGIPLSIVYDNTTIAVAKILGEGKRVRTQVFNRLHSHYLFAGEFARPARGNEKGHVEGDVGFSHRNFMVPIPRFEFFDAFEKVATRANSISIVRFRSNDYSVPVAYVHREV